jgi:hypothetical protein
MKPTGTAETDLPQPEPRTSRASHDGFTSNRPTITTPRRYPEPSRHPKDRQQPLFPGQVINVVLRWLGASPGIQRTQVRSGSRCKPSWHAAFVWGIGGLQGAPLTQFVTVRRRALADAGYLALAWPARYGGAGLSSLERPTEREGCPHGSE